VSLQFFHRCSLLDLPDIIITVPAGFGREKGFTGGQFDMSIRGIVDGKLTGFEYESRHMPYREICSITPIRPRNREAGLSHDAIIKT
jgi:hypothetical protein